MFIDKNPVLTNWNTMYGVVGNQFPMVSEGTFEFPTGSSAIVSVLDKLPTTLYSVRSDPESANAYVNTGLQTSGIDVKKLVDMAHQLHIEEGLSDSDYNISIDYETRSLFSYGQKTKQNLAKEWQKHLHPIDVKCTEFVPGASYILLVHNNRIVANSKSFARDFTFLLSLSVLDFMYDTILEQKPDSFFYPDASYSYVTPSRGLTFIVCQWLLQVLAAKRLGITWNMNMEDFSYLYKVYKPIMPMYPSHVFTDEARNVADTFKFPHYFKVSKLDQLELLPEEVVDTKPVDVISEKEATEKPKSGYSLTALLSKESKPDEGHTVTFLNVRVDVPGITAYVHEEDIIDSYVKSNPVSLHIYIVARDGCLGFTQAGGREYSERRMETLCNFIFKEINNQKLYLYLIPESDYKQTDRFIKE